MQEGDVQVPAGRPTVVSVTPRAHWVGPRLAIPPTVMAALLRRPRV